MLLISTGESYGCIQLNSSVHWRYVGQLVCVSERTVRRYITLFEQTGDVQPESQSHGPPKLLGDFEQLILLR